MILFQKRRVQEFDPNETFLDSSNLPEFDQHQFEGRIEKPISKSAVWFTGAVFFLVVIVYVWKVGDLQISRGEMFAGRAEENRLEHTIVFGTRGIIYDRNAAKLAWNDFHMVASDEILASSTGSISTSSIAAYSALSHTENDFLSRKYVSDSGFAHLLGFVKYPGKDKSGAYYESDIKGMDGIEKEYDSLLASRNGVKLREVDARGNLQSESVIEPPEMGKDIHLSVDSRIQGELFNVIQELAQKVDFKGGAGVIMDISNGEILAMTNYPEYRSEDLTESNNEQIAAYLKDPHTPFLNRTVSGLFSPGSIVKPFMALAALNEKIITPEKQIFSAGKIVIPNPYHPELPSVFKDWKAHGFVDMRHAIAVSSDVYFYAIGGGYKDQPGLGIARIEKYMNLFGFGSKTGIAFAGEEDGNIPSPEWKKQNFDGAEWLLGNTYHTAIGQYGFQVTPIQVVHAVAALASDGTFVTPKLMKGGVASVTKRVDIPLEYFRIVKEGMRLSVLEGIAKGLNSYDVHVAAKTGTAELGVAKDRVNSWVVGFFPYEHPRYAFAIVMEKGPVHNLTGATFVMRQTLDFMARETPEYLKDEKD